MKAEERKLAALKQEYNNGEPERRGDERNYAKYQERVASMKDDVARTEKNIEALKREMSNLK
jgi:predicted  nucleic acid-binding Zn-ribbon protein